MDRKNCRVCPSCISGLVSPSGCIELSVKGLRDSWRTPRFQQHQSFPFLRIRPLSAQAGPVDTESEKGEEHGIPRPEEGNKSPADNEEKDEDRSRSPRPRVPEPDPNDPASLLASTTALAIGVTSMIGALKGSSAKLEILIQNSQTLQRDLCP